MPRKVMAHGTGILSSDSSQKNPQDEYELIRCIGRGTYGKVYKGKRRNTNALVAIKFIPLAPVDDLAIIEQEIGIMRECEHPNIIAYYGSCLCRDKILICMEYCGGGSLQDIYYATRHLNEPEIAYVCREALHGLAYLHSMGKIHRDIKGANILLTENGDVKLADFGVSAKITASINKRKSFIGTPYWMAPEVAAVEMKGGYNHLCDIWAIGVTAIELAELEPPMFSLPPLLVLHFMTQSSFKPPTLKERDKWSPKFHKFVKKALTKNPKKRPTAEKLLLHPFVAGEMSKTLALELLQRVRSAGANSTEEPGNDETILNDTQMIASMQKQILSDVSYAQDTMDIMNVKHVLNCDNQDCPKESVFGETCSGNEKAALPVGEPSQVAAVCEHSCNVHHGFFGNCVSGTGSLPHKHSSLDEMTVPVVKMTVNGERQRSLSESSLPVQDSAGVEYGPVLLSNTPLVPPQKRGRKCHMLPSPRGNGLPPAPKVHMGACFSKIFNCCLLHIHCTASWIHPHTGDQHILFGADEGIYLLNLNELHDAAMDQLYPRHTIWMYVINDVLMSLSGKPPQLYRHDLLALQTKNVYRFFLNVSRFLEQFVTRKFALTTKVPGTKGCLRCCVGKNPYNGYTYLCGALPQGVFLMQWYDSLKQFILLKDTEYILPSPLNVFEMVIIPEMEYPMVCVSVGQAYNEPSRVRLELINIKIGTSCFGDELEYMDGTETVVPQMENIETVAVTQLEEDTVLICHGSVIKIISVNGYLKQMRVSQLDFSFPIESIVCLPDSVLAFHAHGVQGRSLRNGEVTQEITDSSHKYRLIGSDKLVVLESHMSGAVQRSCILTEEGSDLYILAGHEAS